MLKRPVLLRSLLVCLSLLVGLGLLELGLRMLIPRSYVPEGSEPTFSFTTETRRYKVMSPSNLVVVNGVPLRTNALGFRDDDDEVPPKPPGELRIIVLGDSITVGAGVPYDGTFSSTLERILRQDPTFSAARVVNLGTAGYGPVQYEMVLEEVGLGLDPDYVVVGLFPGNDFQLVTEELSRQIAEGERAPPSAGWLTFQNLRTAQLLESLLVQAKLAVLRLSGQSVNRFNSSGPGWKQNADALARIARRGEALGIPVLVAVLPWTDAWEQQEVRHQAVRQLCRERSLDCLDLLPDFASGEVPAASYRQHIFDAHGNAQYHRKVGELLARAIARRSAGASGSRPRSDYAP